MSISSMYFIISSGRLFAELYFANPEEGFNVAPVALKMDNDTLQQNIMHVSLNCRQPVA